MQHGESYEEGDGHFYYYARLFLRVFERGRVLTIYIQEQVFKVYSACFIGRERREMINDGLVVF